MHIHELLSATERAPATFVLVTCVLAANGVAAMTQQIQRPCCRASDVISARFPAANNSGI